MTMLVGLKFLLLFVVLSHFIMQCCSQFDLSGEFGFWIFSLSLTLPEPRYQSPCSAHCRRVRDRASLTQPGTSMTARSAAHSSGEAARPVSTTSKPARTAIVFATAAKWTCFAPEKELIGTENLIFDVQPLIKGNDGHKKGFCCLFG